VARKSQRRTRKKSGKSVFQGKGPLLRRAAFAAVSAALAAGVFFGARHFFLNSGFFAIREIIVNKDRGYPFEAGQRRLEKLYLDRNIFSVDLGQVETLTEREFPRIRRVEVRRRLPDRLEIDIAGRAPAAFMDGRRSVVIDREGVVLDVGGSTDGLVRIKGIGFYLNLPSRGEKVDNDTLDKALVLLEGLKRKSGLSPEEIDYIDISDRKNIILGIYGVQVKMGTGGFSKKIQDLSEISRDPDVRMEDIRYIDLRFEDAVISPK